MIREAEAKGPVTNTVLGAVAIDDAWGVILFSIVLVVAQATMGQEVSATLFLHGVWEVVGGILLGMLVGLPMAWLRRRFVNIDARFQFCRIDHSNPEAMYEENLKPLPEGTLPSYLLIF